MKYYKRKQLNGDACESVPFKSLFLGRDASLISHGHPFIALKASHLLETEYKEPGLVKVRAFRYSSIRLNQQKVFIIQSHK